MGVKRSTFAKGKWDGGKGTRSINVMLTDYKKFVDVVETETERIMQEAAEITLSYILPLVPVQYGGLRNSGRATTVKTAKGVAALVSFGGEDAPVPPTPNAPDGIVRYAAVINYDTEAYRATGQALFLEDGTAEAKDEVDQFIMGELRGIKP